MTTKEILEVNKQTYKRVFNLDVAAGLDNFSFKRRWLTNVETNTYSGFMPRNNKQEVSFAVKMCNTKSNAYNKVWTVKEKKTRQNLIQKKFIELSKYILKIINNNKYN